MAENIQLRSRIEGQNDIIVSLKTRIGQIRQQTLTFILDQMDTLNMQRDTEVWNPKNSCQWKIWCPCDVDWMDRCGEQSDIENI